MKSTEEQSLDYFSSSITESTKIETTDSFNETQKNISMMSLNSTVHVSLEDNDVENLNGTSVQAEQKRLLRKLDLRIMPLFCLFYFVDFLDRANIGNATLAGLQVDLSMSSTELSTAISAFFITYIIFEIPSNIILEKTNAANWLSFIMFAWGVATVATAFVKDFSGLLIVRLFLGAAESGYIPGILFLLSKVYTPHEFSIRVSLLLTMATLSGIVSGPLTYLVSLWDGAHGLHGWQYLFITEGIPTILLSIISYFFLFDDLQTVSWLTNEQKELQKKRTEDQAKPSSDRTATITVVCVVLLDWKTWAFGLIFFLNSIAITSFGVFSPMLISGFGFEPSTAQLLTAPPCVTGTLGILLGGYLVSRYDARAPILVIGSTMIVISYLALYFIYHKWVLYSILLIIPLGIGIQASAAFGWPALNYPELTTRAIAVATILMIGNVGSIVAAYLFRSSDAPRYGFAVLFNCVASVVSAFLSAWTGIKLYRLNKVSRSELNTFRYYY
ncbi:hypothetical protein G6F57_003513 [Rhizopus arrhizus]|uniref:Major facilitator superfamily (MFS) profile domain-containing protein n=1 Tax=Rhizopus oryzae TaxID=64495 RepID=A0A9P7BV92_RHIOR|nr:hypothetical protein G6F24_002324 [Rhizopus arrhizus]KAG1429343.1 hypothetical protein G6F58_000090 [Rhizopus delemar]KAG0793743.1 hypothetical protein G6F21_003386 [Rhizopus arrhizus]KAG0802364.1 hypothetical protein G6F22_000329 [Rhizopus arrhizus]KAG0819272.1 hypothetical protein G6F20_000893 [Rhizopus arrhizus]